ncbi:serine hydrolase [Nostoc sp. 2RC]|uniref:serine hydrolase n=1 Tax=Nostoc sp. 2RC TaxID=2485484 RepID=UPI001624E6B6|nr:serine hydrolase [Nostoc sp. 2RC]MBC1239863.1 serine hydrolase [Nostoc sp. 2RC]
MQKKYRKIKHSIKLDRVIILVVLLFLPIITLISLIWNITHKQEVKTSKKCYSESKINLLTGSYTTVKGIVNKNQPNCFYFNTLSEVKILLFSQNKIVFKTPTSHESILQGTSNFILSDTGTYSIIVNTDKEVENYQVVLNLESNSLSAKQPLQIEALPYKVATTIDEQKLIYNVATPPSLKPNLKLQTIVNDLVSLVASKDLPINKLSFSLIELNSSNCCAYGQYLDKELRFPASVAKLFWMVYLYGKIEAKRLPEGAVPYKNLAKMIQDSDNESASLIVDTITQTKSGESLSIDEIDKWIEKRVAMNSFFEQAGYDPINISQKLFPTDYQKNDAPTGRDLQIRGGDESHPYRNYTTTYNVARLLLEIYQEKAISQKYSSSMKLLLKRNLHPSAWKNKEFNAIEGFLGEALPENAYLASKMGWNFNTRNDAAIIGTPDGKHKYILVIFGDDPSFYKDKKIFPELSRLVYERMKN